MTTDDTRLIFSDYCEENGMKLLAKWLRGEVELPQWMINLLNGDKRLPIMPGCEYFVSAPNNINQTVVDFPPMVLTNMHTRRLMNQQIHSDDPLYMQTVQPARTEFIFEFVGVDVLPLQAELRVTTYGDANEIGTRTRVV